MLGVLVITSEYGTGMIRATLAAVPAAPPDARGQGRSCSPRPPLVAGIAACFAAYLAFQAFLPRGDAMRTSLATPACCARSSAAACT